MMAYPSLRTLRGIVGMMLLAALPLLASCTKKSPDDLLGEGIQAIQTRDLYGAESKFQKVVDDYPETKQAQQARLGLIQVYRLTSDYDSALAQCDKLIQDLGGVGTPNGFQVYMNKISLYADQKKWDEALSDALETSKSLTTLPPDRQVAFETAVGMLYLDGNKPEKAIELGQRMLDQTADQPGLQGAPLQLLTQAYQSTKDDEKLAAFNESFLKRFPDSPYAPDVEFNQAALLRQMGKADQAETTFAGSIQRVQKILDESTTPSVKAALTLKLADMQQKWGNPDKARVLLNSVADSPTTSPAVARALLGLAALDGQAGKMEDAKDKLGKILADYPDSQEAQSAANGLQMLAQQEASTATQSLPGMAAPATAATTATLAPGAAAAISSPSLVQ